jgi:lysophospholipase L1-like esterase
MTAIPSRGLHYRLLLSVLLLFVCAAASLAQENFALRSGDTVVFYGDSITDQRLYTTFVETFVVTRYPEMPVRFLHSGWGGDRVTGGGGGPIDERLERDVIAYKPTVMTIMLGMNDGSYRAFDEGIFKKFSDGYEHIVQVMKQRVPGLRITLIQPSPHDDVAVEPQFPGGYNAVLVRYGQFIKELAERNGLSVADLNGPVVEALRKAVATDATLAKRIIPDRVHPGPGGHLLMAECLLRAWGAAPTVTSVEIDAASGQVKRAANTAVTGLAAGSSVTWTQKDKALPMPVNMNDRALALAVKSSDFMEALDQQTLRVSGLSAKTYKLRINGTVVGSYSAEQLDKGLNLAELATPMAKQAAEVHDLTLKRTSVHQTRWRELQMRFRNDNLARLPSVLDNLDALDADLAARQRAAAQPAACYYELMPE